MLKFTSIAPFVLALAAATACDPQEPAPAPESKPSVRVCHFDEFSVDITGGPSAGLKLAGKLVAVEEEATGRLYGGLETDAGEITWTGQYTAGGRISVAFQVGDDVVSGVGPIAGSLCDGGPAIEGIAFGPTVAADYAVEGTDVGHWILNSPVESALVLDFNDPQQVTLGTTLGLSPSTIDGQTYDLTAGGGVVTRSECSRCQGTVKDGACVGPGSAAEGANAFADCIGGFVRNGGVIAALIQYFDI